MDAQGNGCVKKHVSTSEPETHQCVRIYREGYQSVYGRWGMGYGVTLSSVKLNVMSHRNIKRSLELGVNQDHVK